MSWIQSLLETYENCSSLVGKAETEDDAMLLPVAHTTQNAHVEITIDSNGNLLPGAHVITDKSDSITVIPCTEKSQSRSGSAPVNHPLFDKLQYLAGDYVAFGGDKGSLFHDRYMQDLELWCHSPHAHPRVKAVLKYLEKGCLIRDLVVAEILPVDNDGKIIREWKKEFGEKRGVFKAGSVLTDSLDAFIRINVNDGGIPQDSLWLAKDVWEHYVQYFLSLQEDQDTCYIQGKVIPCSDMSPSKIRGTGDKAKIISSNDSTGFTYRGRFTGPAEAARIGYETTQKAHNALKWLISKQGFRNGEQVFVAWGTRCEPLPSIKMDSCDILFSSLGSNEPLPSIQTEYSIKLKRAMAGYQQKLTKRSKVVVMGLDSATTGRLSIIRYQELAGSEFIDRLFSWYETCIWLLDYKKDAFNEKAGTYLRAVGTPSPLDILFAVYGKDVSDKLKKSALQRLMACILDGIPIPRDFILSAMRRAGNPNTMELWEYRKTLAIACALIRKYHFAKGDVFEVSLDHENKGRSYLFGRVLAYYQYIEQQALRLNDEKRPTNAMRLKYQYSLKPVKTLAVLDQKIQPYIMKSDGKLNRYVAELNKVLSELDGDNCANLKKDALDETYLLGFSSQLNELYNRKDA